MRKKNGGREKEKRPLALLLFCVCTAAVCAGGSVCASSGFTGVRTGDQTPVLIYTVILIAAAFAFLIFGILFRKRTKKK